MNRSIRWIIAVVSVIAILVGTYGSAFAKKPGDASAIVLRGTVVTPDGVIKHGYVLVRDGRIVEVSDKQPKADDAVEVNTTGIIYPGLVDVHNHITYNAMPRWDPAVMYSNRYQWRADAAYRAAVAIPYSAVEHTNECDLNTYGEMRALIGGTTSVMTTHRTPCVVGFVRNLDWNSGFYGTTELNLEHVISELELPPASNTAARRTFLRNARLAIAFPGYEALFIHLSEGVDASSLEEFTYVQSQGLLNPKGVIIHGIPYGPGQFAAMAASGTGLVWSPRSNIELYGQTANINAALDAGVEIALAPDWAVTGSSTMLDELQYADQWNQTVLGGRLSDQQLFEMVTRIPAHLAGVDDEVGAIVPGLRADLLVIDGDHNDPYRALIEAEPADVQLVMIDGVPLYGGSHLMSSFWDSGELEPVMVGSIEKVLAVPAVTFRWADVVLRLEAALNAQGSALAPLVEP